MKTAAVPAIVCSSELRNSDGGTRPHPSGTGPGLRRSAGTSPGDMRNRADPITCAGEDRLRHTPRIAPSFDPSRLMAFLCWQCVRLGSREMADTRPNGKRARFRAGGTLALESIFRIILLSIALFQDFAGQRP